MAGNVGVQSSAIIVQGLANDNVKGSLFKRLLKEINQLNSLYRLDKKKETSVVEQVEDVNFKIRVQQNLIKVINEQANQLTREINANQREITQLRNQLKELKEDYAKMIVKSYKSKSEQSKVMFLLSSDNFKQAYKRLQYINQYKAYQKKQAEDIKAKTLDLQTLFRNFCIFEKQFFFGPAIPYCPAIPYLRALIHFEGKFL